MNLTSFSMLLGLLFIGLKLSGFIDWAWGWVLLPIYLPIVVGLVALTVGFMAYRTVQRIQRNRTRR